MSCKLNWCQVNWWLQHTWHTQTWNKQSQHFVQSIRVRSTSLVPHRISGCFSSVLSVLEHQVSGEDSLGIHCFFTPFQSSHCTWSMFVLFVFVFCLFLKNKNKQKKRNVCVFVFELDGQTSVVSTHDNFVSQNTLVNFFSWINRKCQRQQFDGHKIVFLDQQSDSSCLLKIGTSWLKWQKKNLQA